MTNAKYHRCRKALTRIEQWSHLTVAKMLERDTLRRIVSEYQAGGLRAKNGRGKGLHSSRALA